MRSRRRASHTSTAPRRCTRVSTHTYTFTHRHARTGTHRHARTHGVSFAACTHASMYPPHRLCLQQQHYRPLCLQGQELGTAVPRHWQVCARGGGHVTGDVPTFPRCALGVLNALGAAAPTPCLWGWAPVRPPAPEQPTHGPKFSFSFSFFSCAVLRCSDRDHRAVEPGLPAPVMWEQGGSSEPPLPLLTAQSACGPAFCPPHRLLFVSEIGDQVGAWRVWVCHLMKG